MKLGISLALALLLLANLAFFSAAQGIDASLPRVVDDAGLLTESEIDTLQARIQALVEEYQFDIVIVTQQSTEGKTPEAYADDFFDYGGYGWRNDGEEEITDGSGILFLLAMKDRDWHISTKGSGISYFYDSDIQQIGQDMLENLRAEEYAGAFDIFLDHTEARLAAGSDTGETGGANAQPGASASGIGGLSAQRAVNVGVLLVGLGVSLILALVIVGAMKRKMNTARPQESAQAYVREGSFVLTAQSDQFIRSDVTKTRIETSSSDSGGSTHTSSSGSRHGGGGGKF
jgi:uncharacterized protein